MNQIELPIKKRKLSNFEQPSAKRTRYNNNPLYSHYNAVTIETSCEVDTVSFIEHTSDWMVHDEALATKEELLAIQILTMQLPFDYGDEEHQTDEESIDE